MCGSKYVLCISCLVSGHVSASYALADSTETEGKVTFEEIPVLYGSVSLKLWCCSSYAYSFRHLVYVQGCILFKKIGGVVYNHHICLGIVHLQTHLDCFIR